jgi:predicted ATPase
MLIEQLRIKNILSFRDTNLKLGQLNVLIGPNAVGKSNLIEVVGLLQAAPTGLAAAIMRGGGIRQWLWLGDDLSVTASIECEMRLRSGRQVGPLTYKLQFMGDVNGYAISSEELAKRGEKQTGRYFSRAYAEADVFGQYPQGLEWMAKAGKIPTQMQVQPTESLLSQFKNPADPTPITACGRELAEIQIFREFRTGPRSAMRQGISTDTPKDGLQDGGDNLAMVLQDLSFRDLSDRINKYLKRFCERFDDVKVDIEGGLARTYLSEAGLKNKISSSRMSDGTLKFISLLAALFHPKAPPLMCIEEPELGLHPDALQLVAELLMEASESMQLIVTTHSEALVDALTDHPETVLVCERDFDNGTQMKRVPKKKLKLWLERYKLGELWRKGEIGGSRW